MNQSPLSRTVMNFSDALREVIKGKKITKLEWGNQNIYIFLHNEHLKIMKLDGKMYDLIVSEADLLGEDWVLVQEN